MRASEPSRKSNLPLGHPCLITICHRACHALGLGLGSGASGHPLIGVAEASEQKETCHSNIATIWNSQPMAS